MAASPSPFLGEPRDRRGDDFGERAEGRDQRLGERLDVAARQGAEQDEFEQLVVGQRLVASGAETLAQPLAVAVIMGLRLGEALAALAFLFQHRDGRLCRRDGAAQDDGFCSPVGALGAGLSPKFTRQTCPANLFGIFTISPAPG
jgi:hypothetical protein